MKKRLFASFMLAFLTLAGAGLVFAGADSDTESTAALIQRGNDWLEKNNFDLAMEDFNAAVKQSPKDATAYHARGNAWWYKGGDYLLNAIDDYNKAIKIDSKYVDAYKSRAMVQMQRGEGKKAKEDCGRAIKLSPKDAEAYRFRADVYRKLERNYDKAIEDYNKALELDPGQVATYNNRGITWDLKGDYDKAISDFSKAMALAPNKSLYIINRAASWHRAKEYDNAIADYTKAVEIDTNNVVAYRNRADAWEKKGDTKQAALDRAIVECNQMINARPKSALMYALRGAAWLRHGQNEKAVSDCDKALEIAPNEAYAVHIRNIALKRQGKAGQNDASTVSAADTEAGLLARKLAADYYDRGVASFEKIESVDWWDTIGLLTVAIELDPNHANCAKAYLYRGMTWQVKYDLTKATADLQKAIVLDPSLGTVGPDGSVHFSLKLKNDARSDMVLNMSVSPSGNLKRDPRTGEVISTTP